MSAYKELKDTIKKMESDLKIAREASNKPFLNDYEQGYADAAVESLESTIRFTKEIARRLSWNETPNPVRGDMENEFGDVPPIRQGMGG